LLATDETFAGDGLRVQAVTRRNAATARTQYLAVLRGLRTFLAASDLAVAREQARGPQPPPLNLVIVPQPILDQPALWPGVHVSADSTYPSRYVAPEQTLFVNDGPSFERDLPYGVALHALTPVRTLSTADLLSLAEKFEAYYNSLPAR
jgi:hypothetical protein